MFYQCGLCLRQRLRSASDVIVDSLMTIQAMTPQEAHKAKQLIPTEWELIGQLIETAFDIIHQTNPGAQQQS